LSSFIFIALLIALLMLNEFKRFGESQTQVHVAFWSLCLISWMISLIPILLGFIGIFPFLLAVVVSALVFWGYYKWLAPKLAARPGLAKDALLKPFAAIQALFVVLYFAHAIPPVPLSITYMGIYHDIQKANGGYELSYTRSRWKFWEHGDQTFESADAIPITVTGGREEGYRAVTKKENYQPGDWRVQIETRDSREIGRIHFTVESDQSDQSADPRETKIETR
jgi:hypothetical protein